MKGVVDTSVVISSGVAGLPEEVAISAATLAELHFGVQRARTATQRAARLQRLSELESAFETLPVDGRVARAYGALAPALADEPRRRVMDLLIAATARAHAVPLFTRDQGFAALGDLVDVRVI